MKRAELLLVLALAACKELDDGRECTAPTSTLILIPMMVNNTIHLQQHWIHGCAAYRLRIDHETPVD